MSENNKKSNEKQEHTEKAVSKEEIKEQSVSEKLKTTEDKLLRSLAEIENEGQPTEESVAATLDAIK